MVRLIVSLLAALLVSCNGGSLNESSDVSAIYAETLTNKALFLDVREENEILADGIVKGAQWIPTTKFSTNPKKSIMKVKELKGDKKLYIYCRSGGRAGRIVSLLKQAGVEAKNIGGFSNLTSNGVPKK